MPNKSIGNAILKAIPVNAMKEVTGYIQQAQDHSLVENIENVINVGISGGMVGGGFTGGLNLGGRVPDFSGPFGQGPVPEITGVLEELHIPPVRPSISVSNKGLGFKFGSLNVFNAPSAHQIALDTAQVVTKVIHDPNEALNEVGQQVQDAIDVVEKVGQVAIHKASSIQQKAESAAQSVENDIKNIAQNIIHPNFLHFVGF